MASWLVRYQLSWLRWDLLAGLTAAAVVLPQALAYASLAGLPVQVGLYVALVPMLVYALLGTSRPLSVSSTSTISILTAGALAEVGAATDPGRAAAAAKTDPPVDADRELLALGAANLGGGLFQAYPAGGGTSQSAVNDGAGARTQLAEVVTAGMAVLTLTVLATLLADLAEAILGAIVLVVAIGLVNLAPLRRISTIRRRDFSLGLVALAGVLTFGVLRGVLIAVLISLLALAHEANHPRIVTGRPVPGLLVVRPEGRLYFANGRRVCEQILQLAIETEPASRVVVLDADAVPDLEITALERLADLAEDLHGRGMALWVTGLGQRPYEMTRRAAELLGRTSLDTGSGPLGVRFFERLDQAAAAYERRAEPDRPPA